MKGSRKSEKEMEDEKQDEVQKKRLKSEPMKKADTKNTCNDTSLCTVS